MRKDNKTSAGRPPKKQRLSDWDDPKTKEVLMPKILNIYDTWTSEEMRKQASFLLIMRDLLMNLAIEKEIRQENRQRRKHI